jgi:predicted lipoprotein with Yx(FWY)xxD motif
MRRNIFAVLLGICTIFALSACNALDLTPENASNDSAAENVDYPAEGGGAETTSAAPGPVTPAGPIVKALKATVGTIVTTAKGLPLYRTDQDAPGKTNCYNACAAKFTAYPWSENLTVEGVDQKYVGKVQRKDGSYQLTINKWPVYTNVDDASGTWKAHGQSGTWWLITPDGKKVPAEKKN